MNSAEDKKMLFLAGPLLVLYEVGIIGGKIFGKKNLYIIITQHLKEHNELSHREQTEY